MKASELYVIAKRNSAFGNEEIDFENIFIDVVTARSWAKDNEKKDSKSHYRVIPLQTAISEEKSKSYSEGVNNERESDW